MVFTTTTQGVKIVVTTDVPCRLAMRISDNEPQVHLHTVTVRGFPLRDNPYFCFTAYKDYYDWENVESLIHTFWVFNWPFCTTRYVYFFGTRAGVSCQSTSPPFRFHNQGYTTEEPPSVLATEYVAPAPYTNLNLGWIDNIIGPFRACMGFGVLDAGSIMKAQIWVPQGVVFPALCNVIAEIKNGVSPASQNLATAVPVPGTAITSPAWNTFYFAYPPVAFPGLHYGLNIKVMTGDQDSLSIVRWSTKSIGGGLWNSVTWQNNDPPIYTLLNRKALFKIFFFKEHA